MWVDHFSHFLHTQCHEQVMIQSALESKESFEIFAKCYNVRIKHIHSYNSIFMMKVFKDHVVACDQQQSFCGVGAHWQNGVIKHYIGIITTHTHTMLLHTIQMWLEVITSEFWSYAFLHAVHLHNCTPWANKTKSPFTLFTDEVMTNHPNDFKVFGSPVYVLDPSLQSGSLGPSKWKERAYQGVYIHWTFAAPCKQCNPCIQPKNMTGITSIPCRT